MTYLIFYQFFFNTSRLLSASFFKLWKISKNFSNVFIEKNLHISGSMKFKPVLFKGVNRIEKNWPGDHCSRAESLKSSRSSHRGSVVNESWGFGFDPWPCSVGQRSGVALNCGVGRRHSLDPVLPWLWHRLAADWTPTLVIHMPQVLPPKIIINK